MSVTNYVEEFLEIPEGKVTSRLYKRYKMRYHAIGQNLPGTVFCYYSVKMTCNLACKISQYSLNNVHVWT
jgi:hypothetical protein